MLVLSAWSSATVQSQVESGIQNVEVGGQVDGQADANGVPVVSMGLLLVILVRGPLARVWGGLVQVLKLYGARAGVLSWRCWPT